MPLYELFCLARPQLRQAEKAELFKKTAEIIFGAGGVVTDLKNFGERPLAYKVAGVLPGERHEKVRYQSEYQHQLLFLIIILQLREDSEVRLSHPLKHTSALIAYKYDFSFFFIALGSLFQL